MEQAAVVLNGASPIWLGGTGQLPLVAVAGEGAAGGKGDRHILLRRLRKVSQSPTVVRSVVVHQHFVLGLAAEETAKCGRFVLANWSRQAQAASGNLN